MRGYQRVTPELEQQVKDLYNSGSSFSVIEQTTSVSQGKIAAIVKSCPVRKKWTGVDGRQFVRRDSRFIGYDGESETTERKATYVLLANSDGDTLYNRAGLSTNECLDFLAQPKDKHTVRVWFRGHYDINHIVKDLSINQRTALFKTEQVYYNDWLIRYFPHKIFTVRKLHSKQQVTYYDTWGFFQSSFEAALKDVLHIEDPLISAGKAQRANFDFTDEAFIKAYNLRECELLSKLMHEVEKAVTIDERGIKIKPRSWHGSGAVASAYLFSNEHVKQAKQIETALSKHDLDPFYHAYYGGRIELLKVGHIKEVYAYDINSAYPAAMCHNPDLHRIHFINGSPTDNSLTGVLHLEWDFRDLFLSQRSLATYPAPLPWRNKTGYISYPAIGRGWHWVHEYREILNTPFAKYVKVLDQRLFEYRPSEWSKDLPVMYEMRRELKDAGDGRQMGLKLTYNSLYGKQAQTRGRGKYRVVIWAGDTTARTRAKLLRPALQNPNDVFAFATDSIYSTKPLDLPVSKKLGEWDYTYHPSTTLLLPGIGELETTDSKKPKKLKVRGMPIFNMEDVLDQIQNGRWVINPHQDYNNGPQEATWICDGAATVSNRIFVTHSLADNQPKAYGDKRGRIITELDPDCPTKTINPFQNLKRHYDFVDVKAPWKKFRLDQGSWGSRMATDLRGEANGVIVDSYSMKALKLEMDRDLMDAEDSASE